MQSHGARRAVGAWDRKFGDFAVNADAADAAAAGFAEPECAVTGDDGKRPASRQMPTLNSVIRPSGVIRPIRSASPSENQTFPSGPSAIPSGPAFGVGTANSAMAPLRPMCPMRLPLFSANQKLPSAPTAIPIGVDSAAGNTNSQKLPTRGSKQPIFEAPLSQNHRFPSGPSTAM
jgi:hypothetical protein